MSSQTKVKVVSYCLMKSLVSVFNYISKEDETHLVHTMSEHLLDRLAFYSPSLLFLSCRNNKQNYYEVVIGVMKEIFVIK